MAQLIFGNIERLEDRHPGFCRQLEAMFAASMPLRKIAAAIHSQYGARLSRDTLAAYRGRDWDVRQALNQPGKQARGKTR